MKNKLYLILALSFFSLNGIIAQQRWQEKSLGLQKLFPVKGWLTRKVVKTN